MDSGVDIISLSWGIPEEVEPIKTILHAAYEKGIIIFAAASNGGNNTRIPFPANLDKVVCIGATDGLGALANFNPTEGKMEKYSTLGVAVSATTPESTNYPSTYCYS